MSTNGVDASAQSAPAPHRGGLRGFADRWPFRRKLNLLVGVPLAVVAALLAYLIADQIGQSGTADDAARLVRDSAQVAELVDRVEAEHQQAILLSVRHEATHDDGSPSQAAYRAAQLSTDAQVVRVRETFADRLPATEAQALKEVSGLDSLRDTIEQGYLPADNIDPAYTNASEGLIDGLGLDRNSSLAATFTGNLLDSLLRADAAHSAFETSVFSARTGDTNALIEYNNAVASYELYTHQATRFGRFATEAQADRLGGVEHNLAQAAIAQHFAELQLDPSGLQATSPTQIQRAFTEALDAYPDYQKQSDTRLKITTSLIGQIADRADAASSDASWRAGLLLAISLFGFAVWITFSVLVRRSVVRPVQALTGAARQVAEVAGRELARVAEEDGEDDGPPRLREVPVTAQDEIGDLATAFNHVQTTAAALLERQVLSRRNVAEMFGNVGRRVSNLTTRQLALIDAVERGETDPALLERLYSIDHIAVRLRRNADSLMLLAGIHETVLDSGPTELTNVVRAALGQIEAFQRVRLHAATEVMVEPDIIGDLTLMVAELLENAVSFSPAGSPVEVTVKDSAEGALILVSDHGLGMSADRLTEENARLVRRERLDLVPTKVLGLFVVGTLARRWEVEVVLSRTPGGGVTAEVIIPSSLLLTMSPVGVSAAPDSRKDATPAPAPAPAEIAAPAPAAVNGRTPSWATPAPDDPVPAARTGTGPAPALPASTAAVDGDEVPGPLPRRVPRREEAPFIPQARTGEQPSAAAVLPAPDRAHGEALGETSGESGEPVGSSRPLRRRVRGATLRTAADAPAQQARQAARPADADAVRASLDEFEAAVERAHRDTGSTPLPPLGTGTAGSAPGTDPEPHDQNHLPEGAEQ
ncbi:ATP-binding protein [Streptomyces sp. NPDC087903]|uniref:ATP-binding protein n=1 Tax=Streptomyces sp. NPDC087903 TaxID=3365819 RepID=UPI00382FB72A